MRMFALYLSLWFVGICSEAKAQDTQPTVEQLKEEAEVLKAIVDLKAQLAALEAAPPPKEAKKASINSPRRHHVYVEGCGISILNQPANGRHTERLMALIEECQSVEDGDVRLAEVQERGAQGKVLADAVATAIVNNEGDVETYANTHQGEFATGAAAIEAARGFENISGYNGWVNAQAYAQQLLNPPVSDTTPPPATRPPFIAPPTDAPTPSERANTLLDNL